MENSVCTNSLLLLSTASKKQFQSQIYLCVRVFIRISVYCHNFIYRFCSSHITIRIFQSNILCWSHTVNPQSTSHHSFLFFVSYLRICPFWLFLCFTSGSVIVHVMTPQMRNFYKLEKRWKEAEVSNFYEQAYLYQ